MSSLPFGNYLARDCSIWNSVMQGIRTGIDFSRIQLPRVG